MSKQKEAYDGVTWAELDANLRRDTKDYTLTQKLQMAHCFARWSALLMEDIRIAQESIPESPGVRNN